MASVVLIRFFLLAAVAALCLLSRSVEGYSICSNPGDYVGYVVDDPWRNRRYRGECVSFVKTCTGDHRTTSQWRRGPWVKGSNLPYGTAIATFGSNGRYNTGHAAIYVGQNSQGIQVYDQWVGRPVNYRTLRWGGIGNSNNGNNFYAIA